jgi:hypothetical protein
LDWFDGRAPSFHDAEVLEMHLERSGPRCVLKLHAFRMTSEIDARGYYVLDKHVIVTFTLEGVSGLELYDFNHQNALYGLTMTHLDEGGLRFELEPAYGLSGHIDATEVRIAFEPGKPSSGVYADAG